MILSMLRTCSLSNNKYTGRGISYYRERVVHLFVMLMVVLLLFNRAYFLILSLPVPGVH